MLEFRFSINDRTTEGKYKGYESVWEFDNLDSEEVAKQIDQICARVRETLNAYGSVKQLERYNAARRPAIKPRKQVSAPAATHPNDENGH